MSAELELVVRAGHPDFLDLPWSEPLEEWRSDRIVHMARGISRHVVRFVAYDDRVYALKETDAASAEREYRLLLALREESLPAVEPVGVARWRGGGGADSGDGPDRATLITRYLDLGHLMDCFLCLSIWVAAPVALLLARGRRKALLAWLGLSGGACVLERATSDPAPLPPLGIQEGSVGS